MHDRPDRLTRLLTSSTSSNVLEWHEPIALIIRCPLSDANSLIFFLDITAPGRMAIPGMEDMILGGECRYPSGVSSPNVQAKYKTVDHSHHELEHVGNTVLSH